MARARHTLQDGYSGLALLMQLNWDRLLFPAAIALALVAGTHLASH